MKTILGLDLGTNSIGWALIQQNFDKKEGKIYGLGSRIIPMTQDVLGKFDSGVSISQTAERTGYRGVRRLNQRHLLRRERLHRVLNILDFLPKHYANAIDFENHFGQFKENTEVKLNYRKNEQGKHEFIFMDSFNEMVKEFEANGQKTKIPYDWTLYYLRKKALTEKISKEELAWVILNFNQKRGYYQLRVEEEEVNDSKKEMYYALKVIGVKATEDKNAKGIWYEVQLEGGRIYKRQSKEPLDNWIGLVKEFIITETIDKKGNKKESYRVPKEDDWGLIKKKTEQDLDKYIKQDKNHTVGSYIYETLLKSPSQKIRGKFIKTIERKYYKKELKKILYKQIELQPELFTEELYNKSINELYPRNEAHQNNIKDKGFDYLFMDDIIFYQRPLKSKKSTISGCHYESKKYKKTITDKETKEEKEIWVDEPLKAIPKSHPLFQEFRLWQFLRNLKIYKIETKEDVDITTQLLPTEDDWTDLFDSLNNRKEVEQKHIIDYFAKKKLIVKAEKENYRWNNPEDKKYPCNETKAAFVSQLKKVKDLDVEVFLTPEMEYKLWHIVYSVTDKNEFERAIENFAKRNNLDQDSFEKNFKKFPPYKSDFGAYSEKAIKKLLPPMRRGKYWNKEAVTDEVKNRIGNIMERVKALNLPAGLTKKQINEAFEKYQVTDDDIPRQLVKSFIEFKGKNHLEGLNTYQACYAIYNRHSEVGGLKPWRNSYDITEYLYQFKQHSLRNPIVEQVVTETLRVVKDIWEYYGEKNQIPFVEIYDKKKKKNVKSYSKFFDKIHIELGREMKNPAGKREAMSKRNTENENTNERIKKVLQELQDEGARAHSPSHQEILKIYEEGVAQNPDVKYDKLSEDDVVKIRKNQSPTKAKSSPTKADIQKYKLWLEQGYISPYTGQIIPLSQLFTHNYEIEHIIPQSRYFDNSLSNKVICESEVNRDKSNMTAYEYILKKGGSIVDEVKILDKTQYESLCEKYFKKNRIKIKNLLCEEVPEGFINRQLNDSRYISTLVKGLLSNLVREDNEKEATSKHIVPVTGSITSKLKQDWGLNDKWNELILPRFKRLNELTNSADFTTENTNGVTIPIVPDELAKGFSKKRIDHRHHALDALVIACCTTKHTNYLGALNSESKNYGLRDSLLIKNEKGDYTKHFLMPWKGFVMDAKSHLEKTIISFKKNTRVINKTNNKYWSYKDEKGNVRLGKDGKPKKGRIPQTKGNNWAIRKPMHKETVSGKVLIKQLRKSPIALSKALENWKLIEDKTIRNIVKSKVNFYKSNIDLLKKYFKDNPITIDGKKIEKVSVYEIVEATATRTALTDKFTRKQLESVTDSGIRTILNNHVKNYRDENGKEQFNLAFNPNGLEELNKNMQILNGGKNHNPIYKVRLYEVGNKFSVGETGNKKDKYVEAAKGTNLFFAIYWDKEKQKRVYHTIPLNEVIAHQKLEASLPKAERTVIPIDHTKGQLLFYLSPNDLVYIPTDEEIDNPNLVDFKSLNKEQTQNVYLFIDGSGTTANFIPSTSASLIFNLNKSDQKKKGIKYQIQNEYGLGSPQSKSQKSIDGFMIKERCWKLKVDRLGNIIHSVKQ